MTRDILNINEDLCDGCGDCAIGCAEGAIAIIDGKARLVREEFCDGFGDCVGVCPTGALTIVRRAAPAFDEDATIRNLLATAGVEAVERYHAAQQRHAADTAAPPALPVLDIPLMQAPARHDGHAHSGHAHAAHGHGGHAHGGGCPGSRQRELRPASAPGRPVPQAGPVAQPAAGQPVILPSELTQWPVQLHLVQPGAPFFRNRELVLMSTCGPIASAEVHQRYLRNRGVAVACPKLDNTEPYARKLGAIVADTSIPKLIVVIMEVPCCRGLSMIARQALQLSGRPDLVVEEHILSLEGALIAVNTLS